MITERDIYYFAEGTHAGLYRSLGCHLNPVGGARFAVWAPNARAVSVIGDWNGWFPAKNALSVRADSSGIWEGLVAHVRQGHAYKYRIESNSGQICEKADPFAICAECPPATASRAWSLDYDWGDADWMKNRAARNRLDAPISIYEVHAGSWRRKDGAFLGYREFSHQLAKYVLDTGFTHVELLPLTPVMLAAKPADVGHELIIM